jgi:hypothetical protein
MKRSSSCGARADIGVAGLLALALLASCGGDGVVGSGGTGKSGGIAIGTVSGFGSVIVDGVAYHDLGAPVLSETAPGVETLSEVRLGERVAVTFTQSGVASVVRIETALSGPVATAVSSGRFSMLGQTVAINAGSGTGPTTQFGGGYRTAGDVAAGDPVDVHGVLVQLGGSYAIAATRIDKLAAPPAYLRVSGVVGGVSGGSPTTFALGGLTVDSGVATLLPAGAALANGKSVTVLALPSGYVASGPGSPRLQAAQVRIATLEAGTLDDYVSGSVSALDASAKTFLLGAQRVNYAAAAIAPAGAVPANGQYVQVQGKVGGDGTLAASAMAIRDAETEDDSELRGNVSAFDAASNTFTVRGVFVDAASATLQGCPAGGLANGLYVQVDGSLTNSGVAARTVRCEGEPAGGTVERRGVASAVDLVTRSFTLTPQQGAAVTVDWIDSTYFRDLTPSTLGGKSLRVEGTFIGSALVASKVEVQD